MDSQTVHAWDERPANDSDRTWHEDGDHWGWGIDCEECRIEPTVKPGYVGPNFAITDLKRQNRSGISTRDQINEIYKGAREGGYDIMRTKDT